MTQLITESGHITEHGQTVVPRPSFNIELNQTIDTIKSMIRIDDIIREDIQLKPQGHRFLALCPFHNEKTPSFYVDSDKGTYHCFGCTAHGDVIEWMTEYRKLTVVQAVKELSARCGIAHPFSPATPEQRTKQRARSRKDDEIEDSLHFELLVLEAFLFTRVNHRRTLKDSSARNSLPYLEKPPDDPWEREIVAVDRIVRALPYLYKKYQITPSALGSDGQR